MSDWSSLLFIPFNKTKYFYNELANQADAIIVDFEDSVDYKSNEIDVNGIKKAFEHLQRKMLIARIGTDKYCDVVSALGLDNFNGVMIPKYANTEETYKVIRELLDNGKKVYLLVENARGLMGLESMLSKYKVNGIFFGSEDYVSDLNATRTENNLQYARSVIVNLSKAFSIPCYDTIYPFLDDENGLKKETELAFEMGFDGKMAIHPRQLVVINRIFKTEPAKIAEYKILIDKYTKHTKDSDSRVMVHDGVVIEPPHIKRMKSIIEKFEGRRDSE